MADLTYFTDSFGGNTWVAVATTRHTSRRWPPSVPAVGHVLASRRTGRGEFQSWHHDIHAA